MSYTLHYWKVRGRGEQIRLFFEIVGIPFADVHVTRDAFLAMREQGPAMLAFGALPMLEDDAFRLCQGPVILSYLAHKHGLAPSDLQMSATADALAWGAEDLRSQYFKLFGDGAEEKRASFVDGEWHARWLPHLDGLLAANSSPGFFVGDRLTHADIAVWDVLDAILTNIEAASLDGYPHLEAFYAAIRQRPEVVAYIESGTRLS